MKYFYPVVLIILVNSHIGYSQTKTVDLIWHMDTSSFATGRSLPFGYQNEIKQLPKNILQDAKSTFFRYSISFGNEKIYLNCCLMVSGDSAVLAIDKNFDSIFQKDEIFRYTLDQYKSPNLVIHFSIKKQEQMDAFFMLGSIKRTSIKVNTPDSLLNMNPLYLQSKNYLRSSFMEGNIMYHVIVMNGFPTMGTNRNFQYLVTNKKMDDSTFSKISNWSQSYDTVLINQKQAIVSTYNSEGGIGFRILEAKHLFGTFPGSKMPKITVTDIENSILQLPISHPGKLHLIEFWGTWCGPCIALYPKLSSLLKTHANLLTYIGIANDDKEKVRRYIAKKPDIQQQVFEPDNNKSIISLLKIHIYPTFLVVDEKGFIVARTSNLDLVEAKVNEIKNAQSKPIISNGK